MLDVPVKTETIDTNKEKNVSFNCTYTIDRLTKDVAMLSVDLQKPHGLLNVHIKDFRIFNKQDATTKKLDMTQLQIQDSLNSFLMMLSTNKVKSLNIDIENVKYYGCKPN